MRSMKNLVLSTAVACALPFTAAVHAQSQYPTKPIRLLTPFAAGGSSDILARMIGAPMSALLGQQVLVDNRPGAAGDLGAGIAAVLPPTVTPSSWSPPATPPTLRCAICRTIR